MITWMMFCIMCETARLAERKCLELASDLSMRLSFFCLLCDAASFFFSIRCAARFTCSARAPVAAQSPYGAARVHGAGMHGTEAASRLYSGLLWTSHHATNSEIATLTRIQPSTSFVIIARGLDSMVRGVHTSIDAPAAFRGCGSRARSPYIQSPAPPLPYGMKSFSFRVKVRSKR